MTGTLRQGVVTEPRSAQAYLIGMAKRQLVSILADVFLTRRYTLQAACPDSPQNPHGSKSPSWEVE
jgi:hypothetical protein